MLPNWNSDALTPDNPNIFESPLVGLINHPFDKTAPPLSNNSKHPKF
jgi:hypothetical protein